MLFYIHYILMTSGLSGTSVLLAVFFKTYTDASQGEIGVLLMTFPFVCLVIKPLFCSMADRKQSHKRFLIVALIIELLGYAPFAVIPFFPQLYAQHPRVSWYILVVACHVGNGGLGVAWSLGDCLAMNMSQKMGTPFGHMRLMGTVSWGVYGFIIGQINEVHFLPKYVPAFLILIVSLFAELALIICWKDEDFEMVDPLQQQQQHHHHHLEENLKDLELHDETRKRMRNIENVADGSPSGSLGGTLRLNATQAMFARQLCPKELEQRVANMTKQDGCKLWAKAPSAANAANTNTTFDNEDQRMVLKDLETNGEARKNPQVILLKMILKADGRVIKYVIIFTVFGFLMAPMNFVFLSMETVCQEKGCNFSRLAGAVLISQATIETIAFLLVPTILCYVSRSVAMASGFLILVVRFFFYSNWYYTADISPYWAVIGEWAHGIAYGTFCIIQADVSLMFANQSRLFIEELRKLGFLSNEKESTKEKIEAEERSVKMALRATMQALFGGFMDGLGQGTGALVCGVFGELYSYISLWKMYWIIALGAFAFHQLIELTRSRWSDTYEPKQGTKAYEIMQLANAAAEKKTSKLSQGKLEGIEVAIVSKAKQHQQNNSEPAPSC